MPKIEKMIALILAGGQGTRLGKLTKSTAKPAVPFGGRYRIIDFTLSNVINSGIETVGVITQYQPLELNAHIGNGSSWGFGSLKGGLTVLQPYSAGEGAKWFEGTAHAIYQNISYIDQQNPDYVAILSGDHIYKMDYSKMLDFHREKKAALTVSVMPVDLQEASRFGIMNTDDTDRIIEFEEKPAVPKSNLASMGIYIFTWSILRQYLINSFSTNDQLLDFGHDVIPMYIQNNEAVFAYPFNGYWRDVGTIQSLWQANMELIESESSLDLNDRHWRIYTRSNPLPAMLLTDRAEVHESLLVDSVYIDGKVNHSIISQGVTVGTDSQIDDSFIMPRAQIGKNVVIRNAIIGEETVIGNDSQIIGQKDKIAVLGLGEHYGVKIGGNE